MINEKLQQLFDEATKLSQERKWKEVIAVGREILPLLRSTPDGEKKAEMYCLFGSARNHLGQHDFAATYFDRAIRINPLSAEAYNGRGSANTGKDRLKYAIVDFDRAIELNPQFAIAYFNRGTAKHRLGEDYATAIADFDRAIELNPQFAEAYNNRGTTKNKMEDYKGALADCDQAIKFRPQYARAYNTRGIAKRNMEDYAGAIADFDLAIELNPKFVEAYGNRGNAKSGTGNHAGAFADFRQALKIAPENKEAIHNYAFALALQSSEKEYEAKYQAQLQAHQEKFEKEFAEKSKRIQNLAKATSPRRKKIRYAAKLKFQKKNLAYYMQVLAALSVTIFGCIAISGVVTMWHSDKFTPFSFLPYVVMGSLVLFPLVWHIRMLNRDKHKYWALREDAEAKELLATIADGHPDYYKELMMRLFDHYDKRGSAHLIADWNHSDTGGNNFTIKPGGDDS